MQPLDRLSEVWKYAPAFVLLLIILWAGHKGWWYWGSNAKAIIDDLKKERDEWRALALSLLKKQGIINNSDGAKK